MKEAGLEASEGGAHTEIQLLTCIHLCTSHHTRTHTHTHTYIRTYIRTYVHTYRQTYIHKYTHTYIHTHHTHTYIHTHHTHTHHITHTNAFREHHTHTYIHTLPTCIHTYTHTCIYSYDTVCNTNRKSFIPIRHSQVFHSAQHIRRGNGTEFGAKDALLFFACHHYMLLLFACHHYILYCCSLPVIIVGLGLFRYRSVFSKTSKQMFSPSRSQSSQSTMQSMPLCTTHSTAEHTTAHSTAHHSTQHKTAQHSTAQHSVAHHTTPHHRTAQHSTAQHPAEQSVQMHVLYYSIRRMKK